MNKGHGQNGLATMRCAVLMCLLVLVAPEPPTYPLARGIHCFKCPRGNYVDTDCTEDHTNSSCKTCPTHHYSADWNSLKHCLPCKSQCPKNSKQEQNCSATTNRECKCFDGFHRHPLDQYDPQWKCRPHSVCGKGQGEVSYGNHEHNTKCEICPEKQFVNKTDPVHPVCQDCTVCEPGSYEIRSCSPGSDRECANDTTYSAGDTTVPTVATKSQSLNGGAVAAIAVGVSGLLIIIVLLVWFIRKKRRENTPENDSEKGGAGDTNQKANGEGITANGSNRRSSTGNGVQTMEGVQLEEVPLLGSASSEWDEDFIIRTVFPYLADNLGEGWKFYILQLPGWPVDIKPQTVIEHKLEENRLVKDRIYECLMEWKKVCMQGFFTKASILKTLKEVKRNDLREELEKMVTSE
ncbi:tumor necrosis factor receptor superfamily member 14-like [Littorina saxatilis]|uniref:TNFR-Cys domain-containing protein n=1 Tax=Littorina saxatilis TaxID=31220 RepID=A0AAN9G3L0_9CAEN